MTTENTSTAPLHVGDLVTDGNGTNNLATVREERFVPAVPGPDGREAAQLVRVPGYAGWFDAVTGRGYNRPSLQIARMENA